MREAAEVARAAAGSAGSAGSAGYGAQRAQDVTALRSVWLYEEDEEARKLVDAHGRFSVYQAPTMRLDDALPCYGRDYAAAADPEFADEPMGLCERAMELVQDEGRRRAYREEFAALARERRDARAYYGLYGKMVRDGVREEFGAWKARREAALAEDERNVRCAKRAEALVSSPHALLLMGRGVDDGGKAGVAPEDWEALQWLKDVGRLEAAERVNGAFSALFGAGQYGTKWGRRKPTLREEDCRRACELLEGDEVAQEWFFSIVEQRAREEARSGETGFFRSFSEVVEQSFQDLEDGLFDGKFRDMAVSALGDWAREAESWAGAKAVSLLGGVERSPEEQGRLNEVRRAQRVRTAAFSARFRQAVEAGYAAADEAGESGLWAESRRHVGSGLGFVASWMLPGSAGKVLKAASVASMGEQSLEDVAARHPGRSAEVLLSASVRGTVGESVGMLLGTRALKAGFRMMPGMSRARAGLTQAAARRGWRGMAAGWAQGSAATALDFGVLVPTATHATRGALDWAAGADDELSTAWEDWKAAMGQLADPQHDAELLVQSAVLAGAHAPMLHAGARGAVAKLRLAQRAVNRRFRLMGGRAEDAREAWRAHPHDPKKALEVMEGRLQEDFAEDPVAVRNRAADALRVEVDAEDARAAMEDRAARALLAARQGVVADVLQDGRVRIYTDARYEGGELVRGEKFSDVDADVAERFLGRLHEGNLREHAQALRRAFAGRLAVEEFLKLYGSAGREELLEKRQSLEDLRRDAARAEAKMRELMAGDVSRREAVAKMIVPEISPELTLEAVAALPRAFADRVEVERERGGEGWSTAAYVAPVHLGDGSTRYVLRHTQGANWLALSEELAEQALLRYRRLARGREEGFSDEDLGRDLLDLREWMRSYEAEDGKAPYAEAAESFLGLPGAVERKLRAGDALEAQEQEVLAHAVVEAFSHLFRCGLVSEAMEGKSGFPAWAQDVMSSCVAASVRAPELARLGEALRRAAAGAVSPEGAEWFQRRVNELWQNHREVMRGMFEPYREPSEADYLRRMDEMARLQDELDARLGRGVSMAPEATEELLETAGREREAAEAEAQERARLEQEREREAVEDMADKPGNEGKSREVLGRDRVEAYGDRQQEAVETDAGSLADADGIFSGGRYVLVQSGGFADVKAGMVPVEKIGLSADAPQFKLGAGKDGVVHPLKGLYRPDHAPICVWQRSDGRLEVISGRHRLAYAKQAGASRIMCYVYGESAERDARWARVFDLEQNIRDNMASEVEVALYVRGENAQGRPLEDAEIDRAGIARQGTRGQVGVMLGRYAADGVLDALRNGMPLDDAVRVVEFARVDRDVQLEGLRVMRGEPDGQGHYSNPGSITEARNVMRRFLEVKRALADAEAAGEQGSLFGVGFGESLQDREFNRFFGRYQNQRMREIAQDRSYLNKLVGSRLSPKQAERYGVDVKDPDGLRKRLDELSDLYERWKNPALHADLMEEMREAFKAENAGQGWLDVGGVDAPAEVPASLRVEGANFSVDSGKSADYPRGSIVLINGREVDLSRCHAEDSSGRRLDAETFVTTPAGNLNWYEFPKDEQTQALLRKKGLKNLPIRLKIGRQDGRSGGGFGYLHVLKHINQMENVTPPESPLLHLFHAVTGRLSWRHVTSYRKTIDSVNSGRKRRMVVELREDEDCYNIISSYPDIASRREDNGIVIKGVFLRLASGRAMPSLDTGNPAEASTPDSVSVTGQSRTGRLAQAEPSVNIHDITIRNKQGEDVFRQVRESEVDRAHFSVSFSEEDICRTREEARKKVGREGKPLRLRNDFLELEAVFNAKSEGKFSHEESRGRTEKNLVAEGYSPEEAHTAHWTAFGNVERLFAHAERMRFERAYKRKDSRKGFLHVYSPFEMVGMKDALEADMELMLHQEKGHLPVAYLLSVSIHRKPPVVYRRGDGISEPSSLQAASEMIRADFPDFVKRYRNSDIERLGGGAHFSVSPTLEEDVGLAYRRRLKADSVIPLCSAPRAFRALGLPSVDIVTQERVIRKLKNKHGLSEAQIVEAVHGLDDPLLIIREKEDTVILFPGGLAANKLGNLGDMMAPIKLERTKDGRHLMASLYPLDSLQKTVDLLKQGRLLYSKYTEADLSTEKAPGLSPELLPQLARVGFREHTITEEDIVKQYRNSDIEQLGDVARFSVSPTLEEDVGLAYRRRLKADSVVPLCSAPRAFHALGLPLGDVMTDARVILKLKNKHGLSEAQIVEAVHGLDDPLLIIREKDDAVILFPGGLAVNKLGNSGDMMAPIKLKRAKDGGHFMASLYPLDSLQKTIDLLKQGKLLYSKYTEADLSTEKAPGLSPELLPQLARVGFHKEVITEEDIVKKYRDSDIEQLGDVANFSLMGEDLTRCYAVNGNGERLGRDVLIQTPAGRLNWYEFPKDERTQALLKKKGIKDLPVRLKVGRHFNEHQGFGWLHLLNHFDDMAARGESPLLHLYNTLTNLTGMNAQGGSRYAFKGEKSYNEPSFLVVDLIEDAGCYSIVTCYPTARRQMLKGSELLIGRAVFRFTHGNDETRLISKTLPKDVTDKAAIASGKARRGIVSEEPPSVNIHDITIRNKQGEDIFRQVREPEVDRAHFSLFSPAEASAMKALQNITKGKGEAVFRSDTLGEDVLLPLGSAGRLKDPSRANSRIVGEHGFLHIISTRMAHGESLEEAAYTCAKAVMAAVNGRINEAKSRQNKKMLCLDGYDTWVYLKWKDEDKAWVVTGYRENDKKTDADAKRQAVNLAESYALDSFGGLNQVGAALEYAIARVAREYKENNADDARKLIANFSLGGERAETIRKGFDGSLYSDKELASVLSFYGVAEPSPDTVKAIWKEVLNAVYSGNLPERHDQMLPVSPTPAVLRMLGVPNLMMATPYQVLKNVGANPAKGAGHHLHYVLKEHMEQLPEKMEDPLAILIPKKKLKGQRQAFVFLTDMVERRPGKDEGSPENESNIIVAVHVDVALNNKGARINKIASVYGKEEIRDWKYAYINNKLLDEYPVKSRLQLPSRSDIERGADGIVRTKEDLVKWKSDNKVHFSLGGERAETFGEMQELGLTYFDPADGKRKFCLDSRGARLSGGFTRGQVLGVKEGKHVDVSLKALVAFPELYRAYPELARLRVRVFNGGRDGAGLRGYYAPHDRNGAHIAVNVASLRASEAAGVPMEAELLDTLLHEAQHAIQYHEGWSRGAGEMDMRGAQKYLAKAILARKEKGLETDWARDNLAFMEDLLERVNAGDKLAVESVYWLSHGEQEARFAGAMHGEGASEAGLDPMKALARMPGRGVSAVAEGWMTVPVPAEVTELGGLTFGQAGKYARVMDNRLAPLGDFQVDRRLFQKREAVMRRIRELRALSPGKEGAEGLMLEAVQVAHELVSALPKEYGFGLEPYEVWLAVFSKLGGEGSPEAAAGMAPMRGWNRTMLASFDVGGWTGFWLD